MLGLNVLSSGKDIKLHDLPTLESKFTFKRSLVDTRTLFAFPEENIFVSVYQDNRVDLLKAYTSDNGSSKIKRIKKFKLDGVTCGNVMSQDGKHEIAMGLSNGTIAFVDFNTNEMIDRKFSSDAFGNSVVDISFNNDYSVLGSTYERGEVQLFDMKIKRKMHRYKLDLKSDLVKFHPANPHLLAVTSLAGGISVLNINIRKTTYSNPSAHRMYSKGICWSPSSSSILMSVANDCHMKIFDVRQSVTVAQTKHTYPYSTLAISPCGTFCCAGDMKGSIMLYDLRNINTVMHSNRSHEGSCINKLFFTPCSVDTDSNVDDENQSEVDSVFDEAETEGSSKRRMSGLDFIDKVHPVKVPNKEISRRTSMDDFFDLCHPRFVSNEKKPDSQLETLHTVFEASVTGGSSNSNNVSSMETEFNESRSNPKRRFTLLPSDLQQMYNNTRTQGPVVANTSILKPSNMNESNKISTSGSSQSLYSDNKENYDKELPQNQLTDSNNDGTEFAYARSNAAYISQMNEMSEKIQNLETRLDNVMYNVSETMLKMEKKLDTKMDDLSAQIQQGFLSIHCNLWSVAESDIAKIKSMVSTIHENYRKIEDVFLENASLKEQLKNLKSTTNPED